MSNLNKALAIASLGIKVIPVKGFDTHKPKTPYTQNGCSDATTDVETIKAWFTKYPTALVGYTGVLVLDIDKGHDSGKDGFFSIDEQGVDVPATFHYTSNSQGEHHIYKPVDHYLGQMVDVVTPQGVIIEGVDRKGVDNTYAIWWGDEVPTSMDAFSNAPAWFLQPLEKNRVEWTGTIEEWLSTLTDEPMSFKMYRIVSGLRFPQVKRQQMLDAQWAIVNEHAKGEAGAKEALDKLFAEYCQGEWDTPEHQKDFRGGLVGAIQKAGGGPEKREESPIDDQTASYFNDKGQFVPYDFANAECADLALDKSNSLWSYSNGVWSYDNNVITSRLTKNLKALYKSAYKQPVEDIVRHGMDLPVLEDEPNELLINLKNCMYNWKTGQELPHNPDFLSTVQLGFEYDKNATCPKFDAWLEQVAPHSIDMMWEVIGYSLMSGNPLQKAVLLVGHGRNGKSTFLRVLQHMMGKSNYSSLTLKTLTEGKFEVASLYGKLANISGDIFQPHTKDSQTLKQITGDDSIDAQRKYGDPFSFKPWAVPFFSTNKMWSSSDTTKGYLRRWLPIPFDQTLPEDPNFNEADLYAEASGIFNKAVVALVALRERGHFQTSARADELALEFVEASDKVVQFLCDEDYVVIANPEHLLVRTPRQEVYQAYKRRGGMLNNTNFYADLKDKGYTFKEGGTRDIVGIKLVEYTAWGLPVAYDASEVNF